MSVFGLVETIQVFEEIFDARVVTIRHANFELLRKDADKILSQAAMIHDGDFMSAEVPLLFVFILYEEVNEMCDVAIVAGSNVFHKKLLTD